MTHENPSDKGLAFAAAIGLTSSALLGVGGYLVARLILRKDAPTASSSFQDQVKAAAQKALTWADYDGYCTGYVASIFRNTLGINIANTVSNMAALAKRIGAFHTGPPRVGDIVFFDGTTGVGKSLTHVGIIMAVDANGTATFGHGNFGRAGRTTSYLNLNHPSESRDENGNTINTALRSRGMLDYGPYLAGQLVHGFATVRPEDKDLWHY